MVAFHRDLRFQDDMIWEINEVSDMCKADV